MTFTTLGALGVISAAIAASTMITGWLDAEGGAASASLQSAAQPACSDFSLVTAASTQTGVSPVAICQTYYAASLQNAGWAVLARPHSR